jgi:uncharacterized protein
VKAGDVVKVKVLEVDLQRRRIALTMKLDEARGGQPPARGRPEPSAGSRGGQASPRPQQSRGREQERRPGKPREPESNSNGVMAEALARAFKR